MNLTKKQVDALDETLFELKIDIGKLNNALKKEISSYEKAKAAFSLDSHPKAESKIAEMTERRDSLQKRFNTLATVKMTEPSLYQIIQYTLDGIEVQLQTTDEEEARDVFKGYKEPSEHEAHLVQVVDANMEVYVKSEEKYMHY